MQKIEFETVLVEASKLPYVKVDRELFLRKELKCRFSKKEVEKAVEYNPAYAGIKVSDIDEIAKSCIKAETAKVTTLSAVAGVPGGFAMLGTIPADLTQYFAHILRILQELIYLYGWQDLKLDEENLPEETKNILTLFVGIMFGVNGAINAVNKITGQVAKQVAKKLPQQALTKGTIYPIVKKVAQLLGVQMTKEIFAKGVAKAVPVIGAVASGGLSYITFKPMANRLQKHLASSELADVECYNKIIDVEFEENMFASDMPPIPQE